MATVNLLPWREERREILRNEFMSLCGGVAVIAAIVVGITFMGFSSAISAQEGRNAYLQSKISELDKQVKEIEQLKEKKAKLQARMEVIQDLQRNRSVIVHMFDELVHALPDGVFFTKMERKEGKVMVSGSAETNARVSQLMRNLDRSDWFEDPNLTAVRQNPDFGEQASDFDLNIKVTGHQDAKSDAKSRGNNKQAKKRKNKKN